MILAQFQSVGRDLFTSGLISSNSGNLSVRMGDSIIITRRGSMLNCLQEQDLIETGVFKNSRFTPLASVELPVHRAIYQNTQAQAIVHAHPPHAVALSCREKEIIPDPESHAVIERVPVLGWGEEVKPGGLADLIAQALQEYRIVLVRGHGTFAIGQLLDEAYNLTTSIEEICHVQCLLRSLQVGSTGD
jgi:L-fuculose-phosphate aldolase